MAPGHSLPQEETRKDQKIKKTRKFKKQWCARIREYKGRKKGKKIKRKGKRK